MKRIIFTAFLLLTVHCIQAVSVSGLLKKYKNFPNVQYELLKGKSLRIHIDSCTTDEERELMGKFKSIETIGLNLSEDERKTLTSELKSLKSHSLQLTFAHNGKHKKDKFSKSDKQIQKRLGDMKNIVDNILNPSINVEIYGKNTSEDKIIDPIFVIDFLSLTALYHIKGEIEPDKAEDYIKHTFDNDNNDTYADNLSMEDSMKKAIKMAETDCVIAFDDKIMPELHNCKEAAAYLKANNLFMTGGEEWIVGHAAVKQRFPDLDAFMVINYIKVKAVTNNIPQQTNNASN